MIKLILVFVACLLVFKYLSEDGTTSYRVKNTNYSDLDTTPHGLDSLYLGLEFMEGEKVSSLDINRFYDSLVLYEYRYEWNGENWILIEEEK